MLNWLAGEVLNWLAGEVVRLQDVAEFLDRWAVVCHEDVPKEPGVCSDFADKLWVLPGHELCQADQARRPG